MVCNPDNTLFHYFNSRVSKSQESLSSTLQPLKLLQYTSGSDIYITKICIHWTTEKKVTHLIFTPRYTAINSNPKTDDIFLGDVTNVQMSFEIFGGH